MNPTTKTILTPEGKRKLEVEMAELRARRPAILVEVNKARAQGDLKENGAYQANKENLRETDRRITKLELMLRRSQVVEKVDTDEVQLGSKVTVEYLGKKLDYYIVGETEADPREFKISLVSPLGKAFLGKHEEDEVRVVTPIGESIYKIIKIV